MARSRGKGRRAGGRVRAVTGWHSYRPGIRAVILMTPVVIILQVFNAIGAGVFYNTGEGIGLICYPVMLLAYLFTGVLVGFQLSGSLPLWRRAGWNLTWTHINQGMLAGLLLAFVVLLMFFGISAAYEGSLPVVSQIFQFDILWLVVIDMILAFAVTTLGAAISERIT